MSGSVWWSWQSLKSLRLITKRRCRENWTSSRIKSEGFWKSSILLILSWGGFPCLTLCHWKIFIDHAIKIVRLTISWPYKDIKRLQSKLVNSVSHPKTLLNHFWLKTSHKPFNSMKPLTKSIKLNALKKTNAKIYSLHAQSSSILSNQLWRTKKPKFKG